MNIESVSNFMEAKTIGTTSGDARNSASSGAGACGSITAAVNQTVDGGWAASIWNGDSEYEGMMDDLQSATTLDEQTEIAKQLDQYYAEQHWTVNLTGMRCLNTYVSGRVAGIPDNVDLFCGKIIPEIYSHMWVTDGADNSTGTTTDTESE